VLPSVGLPEPPLLVTPQWVSFSPTDALTGEAVTVTFTGFLAPFLVAVKLAVHRDGSCQVCCRR